MTWDEDFWTVSPTILTNEIENVLSSLWHRAILNVDRTLSFHVVRSHRIPDFSESVISFDRSEQ